MTRSPSGSRSTAATAREASTAAPRGLVFTYYALPRLRPPVPDAVLLAGARARTVLGRGFGAFGDWRDALPMANR